METPDDEACDCFDIGCDSIDREDLKRCFEIPVQDDKGELVAEALAVLLHLNEELMSQLKTARDQVAEEGNTQVRNLEAANEYQKMHPVR